MIHLLGVRSGPRAGQLARFTGAGRGLVGDIWICQTNEDGHPPGGRTSMNAIIIEMSHQQSLSPSCISAPSVIQLADRGINLGF